MQKFLDYGKVHKRNLITIKKEVAEYLGIQEGDMIAFYRDDDDPKAVKIKKVKILEV